MTIQAALVSQDTFALDSRNLYLPGLITYEDGPGGGFVLTITPIGPADLDLGIVEVIIGSADLESLRAMIDQKQPADPSNVPCYDCRTNQTRLDTLDSEYVTLTQAIDGLRNWLLRHDLRLGEIETAIRVADRVMNATFNEHQARIEAMEVGHDRLIHFAASDQEQKDLAERMASLETVIANLGIETRLSDLKQYIDNVLKSLETTDDDLDHLKKRHKSLALRLDTLETKTSPASMPGSNP